MGEIERTAKKRRTRRFMRDAVLAAIGVSGILALTMVAPNVFQALPALMGKRKYDARFRYQAKTVAGRLARSGLVRFVNRNGKKCVEITHGGRNKLLLEQQKAVLGTRKRKRWDKRYRIVMFDIPERRRPTRARLRALMHGFGFLRLQDSVWIFPYDCEDIIALIKADLRIGKDVLYVIAEAVENDSWIKKHFQLA